MWIEWNEFNWSKKQSNLGGGREPDYRGDSSDQRWFEWQFNQIDSLTERFGGCSRPPTAAVHFDHSFRGPPYDDPP
jgi:hypothetical protein